MTLQINDKNYLVKIQNHTGLYTTPIFEAGKYTYRIIYDGDKLTHNLTKAGTFELKKSVELNVKNLVKYYSGKDRLNMTLTSKNQPLTGETLYITINGVTYKRTTDSNGKASMAVNLNSEQQPIQSNKQKHNNPD